MPPPPPRPKSKSRRCDRPHQQEPRLGRPDFTLVLGSTSLAEGRELSRAERSVCLLPGNPSVYWWWVLPGIVIITVVGIVIVIACKKRKSESERPCGKMPSRPRRELPDGDRELRFWRGVWHAAGPTLGLGGLSVPAARLRDGEPRAACPPARQGRTPDGCCFGAGVVEHPMDSRLLCVPRWAGFPDFPDCRFLET